MRWSAAKWDHESSSRSRSRPPQSNFSRVVTMGETEDLAWAADCGWTSMSGHIQNAHPHPHPHPTLFILCRHSLSACLCVTNNSIICENYVSSPFLRSKSKELSAGCELPAWHDIHHSLPKVHPVRFAVGDSSAFSPRLLLPHPSSFPSRPSPSPARPRPSIHSSGLSSVIPFWLQEDNRSGSAELRRLVQSLRWQ